MKILVAVDGSPHAQATLEALHRRLDWFTDRPAIALLYVHPALPYGAAARWVGKDAVQRYYDDESAQALATARAYLDAKGVAYTAVHKVGDPAHEIVSYAQAEAFDLIAMGTRGDTGLANLVMGSVATKVLAATTVPVLIFK